MPPARASLSWKEALIGGCAVFVLLIFAYWPALHGNFLWDDPAHVTRADLRWLGGLGRIWTDLRATQQYYPVLHTAFWIEQRLWGDNTFAYHLVNVALHGIAAVLLAAGIRRLLASTNAFDSSAREVLNADSNTAGTSLKAGTGRHDVNSHSHKGRPTRASQPTHLYGNSQHAPAPVWSLAVPWMAALLFALHPMATESVAWISEQKNTLSLVFYLSAGLLYWRFTETRRAVDYALALLCFGLALGSKSVTATLPAALLVVLWWRHGRLSWRRDVVPLLPWFAVAISSGLLTAWVERALIGAEGGDFALSFLQRGLLAARVICFYSGKLLWPTHLAFFYEHWKISTDELAPWLYVAAVGIATILFWALRKRSRGFLAGWLLFVGSLFPALGFFNVFPFRFSYVADHFQYLPSMYFLAWLVFGAAWASESFSLALKRVITGAGVGLLLLLVVRTRGESALYRSDETLFRATIEETPSSWMAHDILACSLAKQPFREAEAIAEFRETMRLNPRYPDAHLWLANLLAPDRATHAEALREYERALELRPDYAEAHSNLGLQLMKIPQRRAEAVAHFEKALAIRPDLPEAHLNFADAIASDPQRWSTALDHYHEALRLRQPYALAHAHLARALLQAGDQAHVTEAIGELREAVREDERLAEAHYLLAGALIQSGASANETEAVQHAEAAVRLQPGNVQVLDGLGIVYARLNRFSEAASAWEQALRLDPQDRMARANLDRLRAPPE